LVPNGTIRLVGDETVDHRRGKKVFGKDRHRDAVRSACSYTAFRYGHNWIVLSVLVQFAFASRPQALPVLVMLYGADGASTVQTSQHNSCGKRPKSFCTGFPSAPSSLLAMLATAAASWRARKRGGRDPTAWPWSVGFTLTPICMHSRRCARGRQPERSRKKRKKLLSPQLAAACAQVRQRLNAAWYGSGRRSTKVVTGTCQWYNAGEGLVVVLWLLVDDTPDAPRRLPIHDRPQP
jgi:hypothetical protein